MNCRDCKHRLEASIGLCPAIRIEESHITTTQDQPGIWHTTSWWDVYCKKGECRVVINKPGRERVTTKDAKREFVRIMNYEETHKNS